MRTALMINPAARGAGGRGLRARATGFTLIELLITMSIAVILLAIGVPSLQGFIADQRVRTTASDLAQDIAYARSSAVAASKNAIIQPLTAGSWTSGYQIYVDNNNDSAYTAGTDNLIKQTTPVTTSLKICTGVAEFGTQIIFRPDGTVVRTSAIGPNDGLTVSNVLTQSDNDNNPKIRTLYFGTGGRITVVAGGTACP
jgi:prepilin-type N-terminal cleavage/methylation domain-containing protein